MDGGSYLKRLEAPVFMVLFALIVGVIFCEVRAYIRARLAASILFGFLSSQLFFIGLITSSIIHGEKPKEIPLNIYVILSLFFMATLAVIYLKIVRK